MSRATGLLLVLLGVWLLVASLAGRLAERILSLVADRPGGFASGVGGGLTGPVDDTGQGGGGGGGGAW